MRCLQGDERGGPRRPLRRRNRRLQGSRSVRCRRCRVRSNSMVPAGGIVLAYARDCWRRIVTKVLTGLTSCRLQISRFAKETQVTAQLEQPNIAPVCDIGLTGWGAATLPHEVDSRRFGRRNYGLSCQWPCSGDQTLPSGASPSGCAIGWLEPGVVVGVMTGVADVVAGLCVPVAASCQWPCSCDQTWPGRCG